MHNDERGGIMIRPLPVQLMIMVIVVGFLAACAPRAPEPMSDQVRMIYETGLGYMREGKPQDAIETLKQANEMSPNQYEIHHAIGLAYFQIGIVDTAKMWLEGAKKLNGTDPEVANNMASVYIASGEYGKAVTEANIALKDPNYRTPAAAFFNRGMAYYYLGDLQNAETDLKESIRRQPLFDRAHLKLGRLYYDRGEYEKAAAALNTSLRLNDKSAEAYFYRAMTAWHQGYVTKAEEDLSTLLRLVPKDNVYAEKARTWLSKIR